ncbi:Putative SOS response-associated peptidase YedK [Monaibacterium marinum]|uniref:Abasic site processing protein n=1 Tax=Pontivivens marinum TaxID=1690039 RepID=A0A2C9CLE2_9RHOB|nr:SOS response-associated peptidase [Monaibacterium marinum]SOH92331.1 Putative SOS response-associated peptidase YedK [Monaibacterium marinum]
MCGRFAVSPAVVENIAVVEVGNPGALQIGADIRPTTDISAVVATGAGRMLHPMRWGFVPDWYAGPNDGPLLINARAETIATKPAFRAACRQRRCLIPTSGFYEWQSLGRQGKRPYWLQPAHGGAATFAGIWQDWRGADGAVHHSCAIVTCAASEDLAHIHHRLPVIIEPSNHALWLGEAGRGAATLMHAQPQGWWQAEPDRGPPVSSPRLL